MTVALVTLGCARNEVDSEELAGRLADDGFQLVADPEDADAVVVNTCGFVEAAKKDSVDTLLAASDLKESGRTQSVVAVGCLAERYGKDLAEALPEADAILGFDDYPDISSRLRRIMAGETHAAHTPQDRRHLLPIAPAERGGAAVDVVVPGHTVAAPDLPTGVAPASGPRPVRRRLDTGPMAPLKLASGCDRRCTFCAIPSFRGSFVSRRPSDVLGEARWLAEQGVRELFLVSENSTSYGKDLGDLRLLETLLPELAGIDGVERVRVSYLQPAETRPDLVRAIATTPGVASYFDLSFQHASPTVLRRMKRFGDPDSFLGLLDSIRTLDPTAGVRCNVIVGFPGETEDDLTTLTDFLEQARLDVVGRLRLLRRGRHRGGRLRGQDRRGRGRRAGPPRDRAGRGADGPAGRGPRRRRGRGARRARSRTARSRGAWSSRAPRWTVRRPSAGSTPWRRRSRVGDLVRARVDRLQRCRPAGDRTAGEGRMTQRGREDER